jgi:hypothetical protein
LGCSKNQDGTPKQVAPEDTSIPVLINWVSAFRQLDGHTFRPNGTIFPWFAYVLYFFKDTLTTQCPLLGDLLYKYIHYVVSVAGACKGDHLRRGAVTETDIRNYYADDGVFPALLWERNLLMYHLSKLSENLTFIQVFKELFERIFRVYLFTGLKKKHFEQLECRCSTPFGPKKSSIETQCSILDLVALRDLLGKTAATAQPYPYRIFKDSKLWEFTPRVFTLKGEILASRFYSPTTHQYFVDKKDTPSARKNKMFYTNFLGVEDSLKISDYAKSTGVLFMTSRILKQAVEDPAALRLVIECSRFYRNRVFNGNYSILPQRLAEKHRAASAKVAYTDLQNLEDPLAFGLELKALINAELDAYIAEDSDELIDLILSAGDSGPFGTVTEETLVILNWSSLCSGMLGERVTSYFSSMQRINSEVLLGTSVEQVLRTFSKGVNPKKPVYKTTQQVPVQVVDFSGVSYRSGTSQIPLTLKAFWWRAHLWFVVDVPLVISLECFRIRKRVRGVSTFLRAPGIRKYVPELPDENINSWMFTENALVEYLMRVDALPVKGANLFYVNSVAQLREELSWTVPRLTPKFFKQQQRLERLKPKIQWTPDDDALLIQHVRPKFPTMSFRDISFRLKTPGITAEDIQQHIRQLRDRLIAQGVWDISKLPHTRYDVRISRAIKAAVEAKGLNYKEEMLKISAARKAGISIPPT